MRSAFALRIISGNIIYNRAMPERLRTLRHCIFTGWGNPLSHRCAMPAPPKGELFEVAGRFLVEFDTLALRTTACALSVKAYDFASSPKGRAKSTARSFLIIPNTLVMNFMAWLPLRGSWRGSA